MYIYLYSYYSFPWFTIFILATLSIPAQCLLAHRSVTLFQFVRTFIFLLYISIICVCVFVFFFFNYCYTLFTFLLACFVVSYLFHFLADSKNPTFHTLFFLNGFPIPKLLV